MLLIFIHYFSQIPSISNPPDCIRRNLSEVILSVFNVWKSAGFFLASFFHRYQTKFTRTHACSARREHTGGSGMRWYLCEPIPKKLVVLCWTAEPEPEVEVEVKLTTQRAIWTVERTQQRTCLRFLVHSSREFR